MLARLTYGACAIPAAVDWVCAAAILYWGYSKTPGTCPSFGYKHEQSLGLAEFIIAVPHAVGLNFAGSSMRLAPHALLLNAVPLEGAIPRYVAGAVQSSRGCVWKSARGQPTDRGGWVGCITESTAVSG